MTIKRLSLGPAFGFPSAGQTDHHGSNVVRDLRPASADVQPGLHRRLLVPAGLALAPLLWLLDTTVDHLSLANEGSVSYAFALTHPAPMELWTRGILWILAFALTIYAHRVAR